MDELDERQFVCPSDLGIARMQFLAGREHVTLAERVAFILSMLEQYDIIQVGIDDGQWWVAQREEPRRSHFVYRYFPTLEELPDNVRAKVAILRTAEDGYIDERIGRRISHDRFWVHVEREQSDSPEEKNDEQA